MNTPYNHIYSVNNEYQYITARQQQAHFSRDIKESLLEFSFSNGKYSRSISPFFFEKDNYNGYTMYLPTLGINIEYSRIFLFIGVWIWNKNMNIWIFHKVSKSNINWNDKELNDFIDEGTKILSNKKFIPNINRWVYLS